MIWLGALALVVLAAAVAVVVAVRGQRRRPVVEAPSEQVERRRSIPAPVPPAAGMAVGDRLRDSVRRQRERAGRLTAGHVQLIDVGAMIEGANATGLSPSKALAVARRWRAR